MNSVNGALGRQPIELLVPSRESPEKRRIVCPK
jgi:hypothetical protein